MRRIDWKRVFQSGVMQLFGATYIMWIERLMAGISHQHVLSYNPNISLFLFNFTMYTQNAGNPLDYLHYSIRNFLFSLTPFPGSFSPLS